MARIFLESAGDVLDRRLVQQLFDLLEGEAGAPGECAPPLDVVELPDRIEIAVDLPGVQTSALRVIFSRGALVVAGRKAPRVCEHSVAFHLAERSFGRFARAIALTGAFDAGRASAVLSAGELRIVIPRIEERRGRDIEIAVRAG